MNLSILTTCWASMLIVTIVGFVVVAVSTTGPSKRMAHRCTIIAGALVFLCFLPAVAREQHWRSVDLLFIVPIVLFIFWTHIRIYAWCDHCNRSVSNMDHPFRRITICPHCGAALPRPL